MTYTITLVDLKCIVSQEVNGDQIYLTLNGERIWSMPGAYTMHQQPDQAHQVKELNFVTGQMLTQAGWQPIPDFDSSRLLFAGLTGRSRIEIWDHDNFLSDDYFGSIRFSENEAGHGRISGVAARDAAHYVLTYEVTPDSPA